MPRFLLLFLYCLNLPVFAETLLPPMHHVVPVALPDEFNIPADFPLDDQGRIDCNTCHGVDKLEEIPLDQVDSDADNFFRNGPYKKLTDFCYQCHDETAMQRNNVHQMLDAQGGLKKQHCEYCHDQAPDPTQPYQRESLVFRLPQDRLCLGCHLNTPHLNAFNHLVEMDEKMLDQLYKSEQEKGVMLPLDGNRILCITCHSPHESGVIDKSKAPGKMVQDRPLTKGVGYRKHAWNQVYQDDKKKRLQLLDKDLNESFALEYQRLEYEVLVRLPAKNGELCLACHQFDQ